MFTKDEISECTVEQWGNLYPINIMSLLHDHNLLDNVLKDLGTSICFQPMGSAKKKKKTGKKN